MRLCLAFLFTISILHLILGVASEDICTPVPLEERSALPDFNAKEFSVDIELVAPSVELEVAQIMMYYSQPKNQIRLNLLIGKKKSDLFFYFSDQEVLDVEYGKGQGRGKCAAYDITSISDERFLPGIRQNDKNIHTPLGVLRMEGKSGFGNDIIVRKKKQTEIRGMVVDAFESCQKIMRDGTETTVKVTHYFSNNTEWRHPYTQTIPIAMTVEALETGRNETSTETYNFFNVEFSVDPTSLETPPGVFCERQKASPWQAPSTDFVRFSGEVIDKKDGYITYIEEVFSEKDKFAVMRINPQDQAKSEDIIQDFSTGLSFRINKQIGLCSIMNITEEIKFPFNLVNPDGKVRQLTIKEFLYANDTYHHVGVRLVRGVPCDAYVTYTNLAGRSQKVTAEWYIARGTNPQIPMKFRLWEDDNSELSVDTNMYDVDYNEVKFGVFDLRPCFQDHPFNHFRCDLMDLNSSKPIDVNIHTKLFKTMATKTLARQAGVIFWRVVDVQLYFTGRGVAEMEFEILDAPPRAGDLEGKPYQHITLEEAEQNLRDAVGNGLPLEVFDPVTGEFKEALSIMNLEVL